MAKKKADKEEFLINKHISLRMEKNETIIYIDGEKFRQCKYLLVNITEKGMFKGAESIDQIAEHLNNKEEDFTPKDFGLTAEQVFIGHCSNLQAWAENNYDTNLLHSNLSLPLLKRLTVVGDQLARKVFKEEVIKRFKSLVSDSLKFEFYDSYDYLEVFSIDEIVDLFLNKNNAKILKDIAFESSIPLEDIFQPRHIKKGKIVTLTLNKKIPKSLIKLKEDLISLKIIGGIEDLPNWIGEINSIEKLSIGPGKIRNLPFEIKYLSNLRILEICSCENLTNLPSSIGDLRSLKILKIRNCPIRKIPKSIGKLKSLEKLIIEKTKMEYLPNMIGNLSNLKYISLVDNKISKLPRNFENLKNLEGLGLDDNYFNIFPEAIKKLTSLKNLGIKGNNLKKLPRSLEMHPSLRLFSVDKYVLKQDDALTEKLKKKGVMILA